MAELVEGRAKRFVKILLQSKIVKNNYKFSWVLDTASLLGGNEIIVAQLFHEQHKRDYNDEEKLVVDWALETLWPMKAVEDFKSKAVIRSQKNFTSLFPLMVQKDLASMYVMVQ